MTSFGSYYIGVHSGMETSAMVFKELYGDKTRRQNVNYNASYNSPSYDRSSYDRPNENVLINANSAAGEAWGAQKIPSGKPTETQGRNVRQEALMQTQWNNHTGQMDYPNAVSTVGTDPVDPAAYRGFDMF
jgi:hypothetical protein